MPHYAGVATLGFIAGCQSLYPVGRKGGEAMLCRRFAGARTERATQLFRRFACWPWRCRRCFLLRRRSKCSSCCLVSRRWASPCSPERWPWARNSVLRTRRTWDAVWRPGTRVFAGTRDTVGCVGGAAGTLVWRLRGPETMAFGLGLIGRGRNLLLYNELY